MRDRDVSTLSKRDLASGAPMQRDTIFRAFSMTKPVTAVAMMILYDEGRWKPSDSIARFLPELADVKVFKGMDASSSDEFAKKLAALPLRYEPVTQWQYSVSMDVQGAREPSTSTAAVQSGPHTEA